MKINFARAIEPLALTFRIEFEEADLDKAFTDQADPDEQLFYDIYSDKFKASSAVEQVTAILKVAQLATAPPIAKKVSVGEFNQPKEK